MAYWLHNIFIGKKFPGLEMSPQIFTVVVVDDGIHQATPNPVLNTKGLMDGPPIFKSCTNLDDNMLHNLYGLAQV